MIGKSRSHRMALGYHSGLVMLGFGVHALEIEDLPQLGGDSLVLHTEVDG